MSGPAGATKKEPGEAEIVKIPSGKEIATVMRAQINEYTARIETNLKGKGPDEIPEKVQNVANAMGFWDDKKGITDLKKFTSQLNALLQDSMKMVAKQGCFDELCRFAGQGQRADIPMYLTFDGVEKYNVDNGTLVDILNGFGKHLTKANEEGKKVVVGFKSVNISDEGTDVEVRLGYIGPLGTIDLGNAKVSRNEENEFSGKKKDRLNLPEIVPRRRRADEEA